MTENVHAKPCLVQTSQGFAVQYNNRLLYSKYNPAKTILTLIQEIKLLPGTIILCISPVLSYGIKELALKLPEDCIMLGIEKNPDLNIIAQKTAEELESAVAENNLKGQYSVIPADRLYDLPLQIEQMNGGQYKRCIKIEFSSGVQFNKEFYEALYCACQNSVAQFWKNRVTLVRFGRKYAANTFKNLKFLANSCNFFSVEKPILVVGAGESALQTLQEIKSCAMQEKFYILAVDAALQTLKTLGILPDAVICEEAQDIIARAFTGCKNFYGNIFLSTSSNNNVARLSPEKNIFYTTEYCKCGFLNNLISTGILSEAIPPLGSVGLSATEIALKIRSSKSVPIVITGMDFSFSAGQTHLVNSFHEKNRQINCEKLREITSFAGSFGAGSIKVEGKQKIRVFSTATLENYAKLFAYKYSGCKNIYDNGKTGIKLGIPKINSLFELADFFKKSNCKKTDFSTAIENIEKKLKIAKYIEEENSALCRLKDIFTGKIKLSEDKKNQEILKLLKNREYLYLHFPDGYKIQLSQSFLNRIRIEIDYFLKIMK